MPLHSSVCVCVCVVVVCSAEMKTHTSKDCWGCVCVLQWQLFDLPSRKNGTHPNRK